MLYKPKFCCGCGDEIERVDWGLLTSRRFCELCETQHKVYDLLPRLLVGFGVLAAVLGFGFYWQKTETAANVFPRPIADNTRSPNKNSATPPNSLQLSANQTVQESAPVREKNSAVQTENKPQIVSVMPKLAPSSQTGRIENKPASAVAKMYFCGAATKKGTPCSHRVKGGGRCWQHAGQTAMLPPEKLIAGN